MNMYTEKKFSLHNHVCLGLTFLDLHYIRLTEGVPNQLLFHYENSVWKIWCMPCMCNDLHGNIHALHSVIKMMNNVNQNVYTRWADNHWTHDIYIYIYKVQGLYINKRKEKKQKYRVDTHMRMHTCNEYRASHKTPPMTEWVHTCPLAVETMWPTGVQTVSRKYRKLNFSHTFPPRMTFGMQPLVSYHMVPHIRSSAPAQSSARFWNVYLVDTSAYKLSPAPKRSESKGSCTTQSKSYSHLYIYKHIGS